MRSRRFVDTSPHASPSSAFTFRGEWDGPVVATAVHAGNTVRPDLARVMELDEDLRFREEDPWTDLIGAGITSQVVVHRSRFEVDLNRPRHQAVYRVPEDCWGIDVWTTPLDEAHIAESLRIYDDFYAELGRRLDRIAADGPFVLLDVHSYNHRRNGADVPPAPAADNPEVNVGTGSLDRDRFGDVVDAFVDALGSFETSTGKLDVRENVRFTGANVAQWTHARYPGLACVLALEFKKTFMDEWTGDMDHTRVEELATILARTVPVLTSALEDLEPRDHAVA